MWGEFPSWKIPCTPEGLKSASWKIEMYNRKCRVTRPTLTWGVGLGVLNLCGGFEFGVWGL